MLVDLEGISMSPKNHKKSTPSSPVKIPKDLPGDYLKCFNCGRCVGDCPASQHSDFNIRVIIQDLVTDYEKLLRSDMLWKCFQCDLCSLVCPVGLNPASLIRDLRFAAFSHDWQQSRLSTFREFYENVVSHGIIIPISDEIKKHRTHSKLETPEPFINPKSAGYPLITKLPKLHGPVLNKKTTTHTE